jgi:hypothetical protein
MPHYRRGQWPMYSSGKRRAARLAAPATCNKAFRHFRSYRSQFNNYGITARDLGTIHQARETRMTDPMSTQLEYETPVIPNRLPLLQIAAFVGLLLSMTAPIVGEFFYYIVGAIVGPLSGRWLPLLVTFSPLVPGFVIDIVVGYKSIRHPDRRLSKIIAFLGLLFIVAWAVLLSFLVQPTTGLQTIPGR